MLNGETNNAYNEFIIKNSKKLNLKIIVIAYEIKGVSKGYFDPRIQHYKMKLQQEKKLETCIKFKTGFYCKFRAK